MQSMFRAFLVAGVFALTAVVSRGDSEIVVAIRYLQAKGTSHSHLYLYREDGKLLRQLTNDNSGQDSDPIFAADGETIVFTREKPNNTREFWSIDPRGTKLKKLDTAPDLYSAAKDSPTFTRGGEEEAPSSSPTPLQEESASPAATAESDQQDQHQSMTALDAVADVKDRPPQIIKAPDHAGEIFWRKGKEGDGPTEELNWVMWFRDPNSGQETQIGRLPGFPSFEPLQIRGNKDPQFWFEGPLRLIFFSCHLDSTNGTTVEAFDFRKRKLIRLSPNYATPIPLPGEAAFLTLTENRYVKIPGSSKTANCSYIERWGANIQEKCYNEAEFPYYEAQHPYCGGEPEVRYARKGSAAICYGASMYRPGKTPAVITIRNRAD
jgi:phage repressor protein C with HTH and peptisase S24 domain